MSDKLPNISIATDDSRALLRSICASVPDIATVHPEDEGTLAARVRGSGSVDVQLLAEADAPERLRVEVRSGEWAPNEPSDDTYGAAAREIMEPLLKAENMRAGTKLKLRVQTKKSLEPKPLPPACKALFESFVRNANKGYVHPNDWRRFYTFVRAAPKRVSEEDVERLMREAEFAEGQVAEAVLVFWHLKHFLKPATAAETLDGFHRKGLT